MFDKEIKKHSFHGGYALSIKIITLYVETSMHGFSVFFVFQTDAFSFCATAKSRVLCLSNVQFLRDKKDPMLDLSTLDGCLSEPI